MKKIIIALVIIGLIGLVIAFEGQGIYNNLIVHGKLNVTEGIYTPNVTADDLRGNLPWNNLTNYPVACPGSSAITNLDDSVTCTDAWVDAAGDNMTGNLSMEGNWIKDVHVEGFTLNATFPSGVSGDCFYVGNISTTYTKYCPTYISMKVN